MANLAHAIRSFQSGGLSPREFFAQVDRALAAEQPNPARLLEILSDEHTRTQLPPDVYTELQRRIEHAVKAKQDASDDATRVQPQPAYRADPQPASPVHAEARQPEPDRMKGIGDTLNGRFVLEECIGFGGMGTVYKALDLRRLEASDRKPYIAIKVLNVQFRGHPKSLITLQREAKKAQTLAHPNIVTVYDFDRDGSTVYLTMEYLAGKPLSQTLRMPGFEGMPYAQAIHIVSGVAKALSYAHERGFVHCDLKPANVFLTDTGDVKVIDFGISRVFQKPAEDAEATVFDPGSLGGLTPAYASPEMLEHRAPDPRDDIYALACITYELLTGKHPFDRRSAIDARAAGMKPQRPKNLDQRQWRALKAALSFDRDSRTPTVTRFLQEISGERRSSKYLALAGSTLALAVLLALGAGYYWTSRHPEGGEQATETPTAEGAAQNNAATNTANNATRAPAPAPPLSLAAVQPVLERVPCSALAPSVDGDALQVRGYIPASFGAARLKGMLEAVPGVQTLNLDVQQVSDEKCRVINAFAPYWKSNRQAGGAASIHTKAPNAELKEGDALVVDITTPGYDSFVYVDYYALDGSVAHLVPSRRARANQAPPDYKATVGGLGNWVIAGPFGTELIVLLAVPAPLFESLRPDSEAGGDYLQAVEKQLKQIAAKYGTDKIAADFVQISTRPRKP
ncbi:serine/threonine protein kinase [Noviherbaspirillum massiliense]|uniref:serine/threonine protein kinase n=1 Tax=Noviherbaspirillum massiliense TaxID=1465823 RepID=UPI0003068E91|nr:serine/threonine protein kinase [Noviherbaspirillum massiliense]